MFMGRYNHTIDPKGRLSIPSKYREVLGDEFVVSKGKTYYFGEDEKMATGWQNAGGADYFLDSLRLCRW